MAGDMSVYSDHSNMRSDIRLRVSVIGHCLDCTDRLRITGKFLGAFAKLRKATICPPAWNNSAHTERVFVKFYI